MKKNIPYGHQSIDAEDIKAVRDVLKSDWLTQGPKVAEFEKALADYCSARYAVAVNNGTSALLLAYMAADIKKGDEVLTTPLTFAATSNALVHLGAKPVFCDIKEDTLNIDPREIAKKITEKTKAIAAVDFAGHPCDFDVIKQSFQRLASSSQPLIIEDAAHGLGSEYKGKKVGSLVDLTTLSFHPVKLITSGEGGAVLTNRNDLYEKMKRLRHHGIEKKPEKGGWYYEIKEPGYNFRLTDFQSALGISQLKKADKFVKKRREIVEKYNRAFQGIEEIIMPSEKKYVKSAWHIYPIQFRLDKLAMNRKELFDALREQGIGVQVHYMPLHLHPFYQQKFGYQKGDFPIAERYYQRTLTLPLFPEMTNQEVGQVISAVKKVIWKQYL